jgi:hypothetical protein
MFRDLGDLGLIAIFHANFDGKYFFLIALVAVEKFHHGF